MGLAQNVKNWFKLLNKNLKADTLVNCFTTESINIEQLLSKEMHYHAHYADSSIICVWTYKKLPQVIQFDPNLNTYILDKY